MVHALVETNMASDDGSRLPPKESCPAPIKCHNNIPEIRCHVRLEVYVELFIDALRSRTSIKLKKYRILLVLVKMRWAAFDNI